MELLNFFSEALSVNSLDGSTILEEWRRCRYGQLLISPRTICGGRFTRYSSRTWRWMQVNIWYIIYLNCGEWYEDMIDHLSHTHNLSRCEIKAWKNSGLNRIRAHDFCDTVQCSTNWAIKPSGNWSLCEFVVYSWMVKNASLHAPLEQLRILFSLNKVLP